MLSKKILNKFKNIHTSQPRGERNLLSTLTALKKEKKRDPKSIIVTSLRKLHPGLTIVPQIRAGKVTHLPAYLSENGAYFYSINWLFKAARSRSHKVLLSKNLAAEIVDTLDNRGLAVKSKVDLTKSVENCRINLRKSYIKPQYSRPLYYSNSFGLMRSKKERGHRFDKKNKYKKVKNNRNEIKKRTWSSI